MKEERQRLFDLIKRQTIKEKWKQVQQLLIDLKRTQDQFKTVNSRTIRTKWTEQEKETILTTGELSSYSGEYYHDVKNYPELTDDVSNIIFMKN